MIEGLSEKDFLAILFASEKIDGIVVGGQALNIWAKFLLDKKDFLNLGPFTSIDIDFWGNEKAAKDLSQTLHGKVSVPDKNDHTPSSAYVLVEFDNKIHQIDFLNDVCGLNTKEFIKRSKILNVDGANIHILHPLDVFKSRIAGVATLRRYDTGSIRQLKVSSYIASNFIEMCLERGDIKEAQNYIKEFIYEGLNARCNRVFLNHSFDIMPLVEKLSLRPEWDSRFREFQINKYANTLVEKRNQRNIKRKPEVKKTSYDFDF